MKWSKLKKNAEALLAKSLQGRIQYHTTNYIMSAGNYEGHGRAWITLDRHQIFNFSEIEWEKEYYKLLSQLRQINGAKDYKNPAQKEGYYLANQQAEDILIRRGVFSQGHFTSALHKYIQLPIDDILLSQDPLILALGMFDRRVGQRRLIEIDLDIDNHPLVKDFFRIRCEADKAYKTEKQNKSASNIIST